MPRCYDWSGTIVVADSPADARAVIREEAGPNEPIGTLRRVRDPIICTSDGEDRYPLTPEEIAAFVTRGFLPER